MLPTEFSEQTQTTPVSTAELLAGRRVGNHGHEATWHRPTHLCARYTHGVYVQGGVPENHVPHPKFS